MPVEPWDGEVGIADERGQPVDPGGGEEGGGRRGRGGEGRGAEGLQSAGEALEGTAARGLVADDPDSRGEWGELLAGGGDDDRLGRLGDEADHPLEQPLGAEREPGLAPPHPEAPTTAEDD